MHQLVRMLRCLSKTHQARSNSVSGEPVERNNWKKWYQDEEQPVCLSGTHMLCACLMSHLSAIIFSRLERLCFQNHGLMISQKDATFESRIFQLLAEYAHFKTVSRLFDKK